LEQRPNSRWNSGRLDMGRQLYDVGILMIDCVTHISSPYSVLPPSSLALSASLVKCKIGALMLIVDDRDVLHCSTFNLEVFAIV
jgi:hypothetical protein